MRWALDAHSEGTGDAAYSPTTRYRLWLLVEPRTVFDGINAANRAAASDFARERTVRRYNRQLNDLVEFWTRLLCGHGGELRALGVGDGVDAVFRLSQTTAFSRRAGA